MKGKVFRLLTLCIAICATARCLYSQDAFSVPVSDEVIMGELILPNGKSAGFGAREGTMITIRDRQKGYTIAFIPQISGNSSNRIRIRTYEVTGDEAAPRVNQIIEATRDISVKSADSIQTNYGSFRIKISNIIQGEFPNIRLADPRLTHPEDLQVLYGASGGGVCCVGCGGIYVCASEVSVECGSCSTGYGRPMV